MVAALPDTSMGGDGREFPATTMCADMLSRSPTDPIKQAWLERLCRRYWKPVYSYIRTAWHKPVEDAKDLAQGFFLALMEKDWVSRYDPSRSTFRVFVKMILRHYLIDVEKNVQATRRGGGAKTLSFADEVPLDLPDTDKLAPEEIVDREWARSIVEEALRLLQARLVQAGKDLYYTVYAEYELKPQQPTYEDLAQKLGLKPTDVRNYLTFARSELRRIVMELISEEAFSGREAQKEFQVILHHR